MKEKPVSMLQVSPKGTVPVMVVDGKIIDESVEIMQWALASPELEQWQVAGLNSSLLEDNDVGFKYWLDRYKYFERYPEHPQDYYLHQCEAFLGDLECALFESGAFLNGETPQAIDLAIFPFIRQFAHVDLGAFMQLPFPELQRWLNYWKTSELFTGVMLKYKPWKEGEEGVQFITT